MDKPIGDKLDRISMLLKEGGYDITGNVLHDTDDTIPGAVSYGARILAALDDAEARGESRTETFLRLAGWGDDGG